MSAMKRMIGISFFAVISALLLNACNMSPDVGGQASFWAQNQANRQWYNVDAELVYIGSYCKIYVQNQYTNQVSKTTATSIANNFDQNVYPKDRNAFGTEPDVDGDGKVTILILDIIDSGGGGYIAGYFDSTHELDVQHSNKKDMLFMDCNPGIPGDNTFNLTMAHEFQHMINFNQKYFIQGNSTAEDTWINEGLSTAAESIYLGGINSDRVTYYNADPYGDIAKGQGFVAWNVGVGSTYASALGNYSTVYLFFQWLKYQASNGEGIFKEIINNTGSDFTAVQTAAAARLYAGTWQTFLRDWYVANNFNDPASRYGYKGNISTTIHTIGFSGGYALYPGEGVYQAMGGFKTAAPGGATVAYVGMSNSIKQITTPSGNTYYGTRFLAFNFDGTPGGSTGSANLSIDSMTKGLGVETVTLSPELESFKQSVLNGGKRLPMDMVLDHGSNRSYSGSVSNVLNGDIVSGVKK